MTEAQTEKWQGNAPRNTKRSKKKTNTGAVPVPQSSQEHKESLIVFEVGSGAAMHCTRVGCERAVECGARWRPCQQDFVVIRITVPRGDLLHSAIP